MKFPNFAGTFLLCSYLLQEKFYWASEISQRTLPEISKVDKEEMEWILEVMNYVSYHYFNLKNIVEHNPNYFWRGVAQSTDLLTLNNAIAVCTLIF